MKAEIVPLTEREYHLDPMEHPSLSATIAHALCWQSPLHAKTKHPRLADYPLTESTEQQDIGKAAHALMLEGTDIAAVIDFEDWRTKEARSLRDQYREAGKVPILRRHWQAVQEMYIQARLQLGQHIDAPNAFRDGKPEQSILWTEPNGVDCRARLDWLTDDHRYIFDYKTTTQGSANPEIVCRQVCSNGWDVQAAFYRRAVQMLDPKADPIFQFVVQETYPPYALCVIGLEPSVRILGEKKIQFAIEKFAECLKSGSWPGYTNRTHWAELPSYEEERWLRKETADVSV